MNIWENELKFFQNKYLFSSTYEASLHYLLYSLHLVSPTFPRTSQASSSSESIIGPSLRHSLQVLHPSVPILINSLVQTMYTWSLTYLKIKSSTFSCERNVRNTELMLSLSLLIFSSYQSSIDAQLRKSREM